MNISVICFSMTGLETGEKLQRALEKEGDQVTVVMNEHVDHNGKQYPIASLPENLMDIIQAGGLVKAMRKLNGLD